MNKTDATNKCLGCRYLIPRYFICNLFYMDIFDAIKICNKIDDLKQE